MSEIALKPCPFCGSPYVNDTEILEDAHPTIWVCPDCVACGPVAENVKDATELWNTRVDRGANDELTALRAEVRELREALEPFATAVDDAGDDTDKMDADAWESSLAMAVKIGDFYNARAALAKGEK